MKENLLEYCKENDIEHLSTDSQSILLERIKEHSRKERLKQSSWGPPDTILDARGEIMEVTHKIPMGSRTFIDPEGNKQARTFGIVIANVGDIPKGVEVIVLGCKIDDILVPVVCNYPEINCVHEKPLMVFREYLNIYNGQSGIRVN